MSTDPDPKQNSTVPAGTVPSIAASWVRYVVGFGVSVAVGLAPYLGRLHVPLFTPMLFLLPESVQGIAIPLSAASMGIVAVWVQWYGSQRLRPDWVGTWFVRTIIVCFVSLFLIAAIEMTAVVRVDVPSVDQVASFAVGPLNPNTPPCVNLSRQDCIKHALSLDPAQIESHFGETQANFTKLALVIVYTTFMTMFGILVGLMMLGRPAKTT